MGLFGGVEDAEVFCLPPNSDCSDESFPVDGHAKEPRLVVNVRIPLVLQIVVMRKYPQPTESVVRSVAEAVVNAAIRPFAGRVEPSKAMRKVISPVNGDNNIAIAMRTSANRSGLALAFAWKRYGASEYAGFRIVVKKLAQTLRAYNLFSHDANLLSLIGQRPRRVQARPGLRYFSVGQA